MYHALKITQQESVLTVMLNSIESKNSLSQTLVAELLHVLEEAEKDTNNRIIFLKGQPDFFCTGMDFSEVIQDRKALQVEAYLSLLQRLSSIPRIVIAGVEGVVIAGGVGLVAASDLVIATPSSQFSLSEALWGLVPCCVIPYLIRRIGFQMAYRMALTTQNLSSNEALNIHLVDSLVSSIDDEVRKQSLRLKRLHPETIKDMKCYFHQMWPIDKVTEKLAMEEITRLTSLPRVQKNIKNYIEKEIFPWEVNQ